MAPRDVLSAVLLLSGVSLTLIGTIGLHRFPDVFARMHAAAKPATLGLVLTLLGTAVRVDGVDTVAVIVLAVVLQFVTTPAGTQMLGRAAYRSGTQLDAGTSIDELAAAERRDSDPPAGGAMESSEDTGTLVALVDDLMDRSRLDGALPGIRFVRTAVQCEGAAVVIVDLARHGAALSAVRDVAPAARIVAFGPHVEDEMLAAARGAGADVVLPRSRFFHDPAAAVAGAVAGPARSAPEDDSPGSGPLTTDL